MTKRVEQHRDALRSTGASLSRASDSECGTDAVHFNVDDLPDRLRSKIDVRDDGCWYWAASRNAEGYGHARFANRSRPAHRLVYELLVGPMRPDLVSDHLCRVRHCVNPLHVEPVTQAENVRRGLLGELFEPRTHCPQGHEFTPENTYHARRAVRSHRECRICRSEALRRYQIRVRDAHAAEGVTRREYYDRLRADRQA